MGLLGNNKELQFGTFGLMANHGQVQRNKGKNHSFMDLLVVVAVKFTV